MDKLLHRRKQHQHAFREVHINEPGHEKTYKGNKTSTTKYNLLTFLPKALFEQYRRVANWYFTIVAVLSLTAFSPVRPWTTWTPLAIVVGVAMIKEALEDYKRYKKDKEVNNHKLEVLDHTTGEWITRRWMDVQVGDIVVVKKDEGFPADLLFLTSENEEGSCYIETKGLDGETNLKIKKAMDQTKDFKYETVNQFKGVRIQCEGPNARLYQFAGNLILADGTKVPISPAAILLRSCSLRNTNRIMGAVIYAGHDTKVFKNSTNPPSKRSVVERTVDKIIFFMFALLFAFCFIGSVYFSVWTEENFDEHWYLGSEIKTSAQYGSEGPAVTGLTSFVTSFILYGYLIPISLYVTMEIVKVIQSMVFINNDLTMYHEETNTPAEARTSNLNEDLGMVTTVLSDKTGTLTRNMMEFFKCSIAGVSYGAGITEIERSNAARRGEVLPEGEDPAGAPYRERFFNFYDTRMMDTAWAKAADTHTVEMFLRLLAVCHTVVPDGPIDPKELRYEAESPDEAALVVAAKVLGFFFMKRTNTTVTVRETTGAGTRDVEYEVLNVIEFNSTRKRMSVVVRDSSGKIIVFCKGADTVICERLTPGDPMNTKYKDVTLKHLEEFGSAGLRTLCLAYKEVDPAFYEEWNNRWREAKMSLQDRENKVAAVGEEIENNFKLLGATAIEDKLQEGVPQCIAKLAEAGIRIWVLTGDKMETAINIGFACSLITEEMKQFIITAYSEEVDKLEAAGKKNEADQAANHMVATQLEQVYAEITQSRKAKQGVPYAMIIDGKALSYALSDELANKFLAVGLECNSVVCCRVSPLQKAQVTGLVKGHGDVTLAIGDGANDVGMIQRAHIGVGISGEEGMQAVMASDFAIAQFRYLTPLLLVHGHWSYKRISRMICFFFYKNLVFGITLFAFNGFAAFSGQYAYSDTYMTLFNVIFTALTPLVIGILDRDVDKESCTKYPLLYRQGQLNQFFNTSTIASWLATAVFQCAVIFTLCMVGSVPWLADREDGNPHTMYQLGVTMFSCIIITVHLQVVIVEEQLTWLHHLCIWGSAALWWIFLLLFQLLPVSLSTDMYYLFNGVVASSPQYWLMILLVPIAALAPDFFVRQLHRLLRPDAHQLVQEREHLEAQERKWGRQHAGDGGEAGNGNGGIPAPDPAYHIDEKRNVNRGYVPPYSAQSRFYGFMAQRSRLPSSQMSTASSAPALSMGPMPSAGGPLANPAATRNPVLVHLDRLLTNNPFKARAAPAMPYSASGFSVGMSTVGNGAGSSLPQPSSMSPTGASSAARVATAEAIQQDNPLMTPQEAKALAGYADALR